MRNYCNRQNSSRRDLSGANRQPIQPQLKNLINENKTIRHNSSDISLPPGGDYRALERIENDMSEEYINIDNELQMSNNDFAQGGAISQRSGYNKQLAENVKDEMVECGGCEKNTNETDGYVYDGLSRMNEMSGYMNMISMPQTDYYEGVLLPMSLYLQRYKGKYICIDLWTTESRKLEKCGVITDVGNDFVVIKGVNRNQSMTMIDLKTVRYISIYCR